MFQTIIITYRDSMLCLESSIKGRGAIVRHTWLIVASNQAKALEILDKGGKTYSFGRRFGNLNTMVPTGGDQILHRVLGRSNGSRYKAPVKSKVVQIKFDLQPFPAPILIRVDPDNGILGYKLENKKEAYMVNPITKIKETWSSVSNHTCDRELRS